jgi:asparagine synthase (glutamine-hydrolysing)
VSTIAAIFGPACAGLDAAALRALVATGPTTGATAVHVWMGPGIGMAARGLRPDDEPLASEAPVVVVFDGRLDDRALLLARLRDAGDEASAHVSDASLVARAYRAWGSACAPVLSGDFAWIAWDERERRLVAARDKVGIKPLYYSSQLKHVLVANDVHGLRGCRGVSSDLSDDAVVDVLLFGAPRRAEATCFRDIARIPPAHTVEWASPTGARRARYWHLEPRAVVTRRDPRQYAEEAREVLDRAVRRRLRGRSSACVLMSGGLDSTSVASLTARAVGPEQCLGVTAVYDRLMPDEERRYSTLAASHLRIRHLHVPADDYELFERWDTDALPPEPTLEPLTALSYDLLATASGHADVALTGYGGDPALLPGAVVRQIGRVPLTSLLGGLAATLRRGRWPPLGVKSGLRDRLPARCPAAPDWLLPELRQAYETHDRWAEASEATAWRERPRAESLHALTDDGWPRLFEGYDAVSTRRAVEVRHPFFDVEVLEFALALPCYPWCVDKLVLRDAMHNDLPASIVWRPKAPLAADAIAVRGWSPDRLLQAVSGTPLLERYIDLAAFARAVRGDLTWQRRAAAMAAVALAVWVSLAGRAPAVPESS